MAPNYTECQDLANKIDEVITKNEDVRFIDIILFFLENTSK